MDITHIYRRFPSRGDCIKELEKVLWNNTPTCPYCNSKKQTPAHRENRYHCNNCNTSFSVTVGTPFHKTKVDLQKWFIVMHKLLYHGTNLSARRLGSEIGVTKDTALFMVDRMNSGLKVHGKQLQRIFTNK